MPQVQNVVVVYHGLLSEAEDLARELSERYGNNKWTLLPAEPDA